MTTTYPLRRCPTCGRAWRYVKGYADDTHVCLPCRVGPPLSARFDGQEPADVRGCEIRKGPPAPTGDGEAPE